MLFVSRETDFHFYRYIVKYCLMDNLHGYSIILSIRVKSSTYHKESLPLACKTCISSQLYVYSLDEETHK